jgi:hypothetical protein
MAGWIKPCPQDLGWLQPSVIITSQSVPQGGFLLPNSSFIEKWTVDLVLGGVYLIGALSMLIFGIKKEKPYLLLLSSGVMFATGFYFYQAGWRMGLGLFGLALLLAGSGVYLLVRQFTNLGSSKA